MTRKIIVTNTDYPTSVPNGTIMTVVGDYGSYLEATVDGGDNWVWNVFEGTYEEYAPHPPASECDTPALWRDMTPEEKGALLLAHHEGKEIQVWSGGEWLDLMRYDSFYEVNAYRIKPEPKVEVVTLYSSKDTCFDWVYSRCGLHTHRITFNTIDGKPDPASIKMEEL